MPNLTVWEWIFLPVFLGAFLLVALVFGGWCPRA